MGIPLVVSCLDERGGDSVAPVQQKRRGVDYRCQDCGLVVTVKREIANTAQHGELMCCNEPMNKVV